MNSRSFWLRSAFALVAMSGSATIWGQGAPRARPAEDPPLIAAIKKQDIAAVKTMLAGGLKLDDRKVFGRATPLMVAAETGNVEMLKVLTGAGADPNFANIDGQTALMSAAGSG